MAKLSIIAKPTFKKKVDIPAAGGETIEVEFVFKHRTKTQLDEFVKSRAEKSDVESFLEMVGGWDFAEEFSDTAAETMLDNYIGAALPVYQAYITELVQAKAKN